MGAFAGREKYVHLNFKQTDERILRQFVDSLHPKKIASGKLSSYHLGLKESDIVYDVWRTSSGAMNKESSSRFIPSLKANDSMLPLVMKTKMLVALRYLVFWKVNNNIIRLYSEADLILGKVLRNMQLANQKERLFEELQRFGEAYLLPIYRLYLAGGNTYHHIAFVVGIAIP